MSSADEAEDLSVNLSVRVPQTPGRHVFRIQSVPDVRSHGCANPLDFLAVRLVTGNLMRRRTYALTIGVLNAFCGTVWTWAFYGFGTWLVPLGDIFCPGYGSTARCPLVYPFISSGALMAASLTLMPQYISIFGFRNSYFVGLVVISAGVAITAVAVEIRSIGLIWLGFTLMIGFASGFAYMALVKATMAWFGDIGLPGLGAALIGLGCGSWGAGSSISSNPIATSLGGSTIGYSTYLYIIAGAILGIGLPPAFLITLPSDWMSVKAQQPTEQSALKSNFAGSAASKSTRHSSASKRAPLTMAQHLSRSSTWIQAATYVAAFTPGFGLKFLIAPILNNLYNTPRQTQDVASFIFLASYAVARFLAGIFAAPPCKLFSPRSFITTCQVWDSVVFLVLAALVYWGTSGHVEQWVFILLVTTTGITLAISKVRGAEQCLLLILSVSFHYPIHQIP